MSIQLTGVSIPSGTLGVSNSILLYSYGGTTTIKYTCGTASGTIVTKAAATTTSVSFTLPISLASQNTSGENVVVTFEIITYDGSTEIGSYTVDQTFAIPASVYPTCSIAVSDTTDCYSTFGGYLVGASEIKIDVSPVLAYGSEIIACKIEAGGWTMQGGSATWKFFDTAVNIKATVTDARGRSYTAEKNITLLDYDYPSISLLTAARCDSDGTENNQGEYIKATYSGTVTAVNNKNTVAYVLKYKKSTATSYTSVTLSQTAYTVNNATYIFAADTAASYDVVLTLTDAVDSVDRTTAAPSGFVLIDFKADGTAIGIGKAAETSNLFDVGLAANFDNGITGKGVVKIGQGWTEGEIASAYLSLTAAYKAILAATGGLSINSPQFQLTSDIANFTVPLYENYKKVMLSGDSYTKGEADQLFAEKVDKTTRSVDIGGHLSSAGWYQVGALYTGDHTNAGSGAFRVVIGSVYNNTYNGCLVVDVAISYHEASLIKAAQSGNAVVSDVRLRQDSTYGSKYYLDIYYNPSASNYVSVTVQPFFGSVTLNSSFVSASGTATTTLADAVRHDHAYRTIVGSMAFGETGNIAFYTTTDEAANDGDMKWWIGCGGTNNFNLQGKGILYIIPSGATDGYSMRSDIFYPQADNTVYFGGSSYRWKAVYAGTGSIQTSDRNLKTDIAKLDQKYIDLFDGLIPVSYKLSLPNSDRTHVGFISQDVKETMDTVGLSDLDFAGYCRDQKVVEDKETGEFIPVFDEDGNPEYIYSLRYQEFIALNTRMIQENRKTIAKQAEEIQTLKNELKAIKEKLGL